LASAALKIGFPDIIFYGLPVINKVGLVDDDMQWHWRRVSSLFKAAGLCGLKR
jgi:hypothetical protein